MKKVVMLVILLAVLAFSRSDAIATITLDGFSFDDNAFADQILEITGDWTRPGSYPTAVLGPNVSKPSANCWPFDQGGYIKVAFTDNAIVNGPGPDFVMFEDTGWRGDPGCPVTITINDIMQTYQTPWLGTQNAAVINLDDFNIDPGARVQTITLWSTPENPEYMAIGALNNWTPAVIPAPGALMLGWIGVGLVGWLRRRRTL